MASGQRTSADGPGATLHPVVRTVQRQSWRGIGELGRATIRFGSVAGLSLAARREAGQALHGMPTGHLPVGVPANFWVWAGICA